MNAGGQSMVQVRHRQYQHVTSDADGFEEWPLSETVGRSEGPDGLSREDFT